jgi:8-oxo-dGTP pyrophosphatase MutT (NUDIX family)
MKVRVAGLLAHEGKFLVMRYVGSAGERFVVPGGGVEPGETVLAALQREFQEELSVPVTVDPSVFGVCETDAAGSRVLHLLFGVALADATGVSSIAIDGSQTRADGLAWMDLDALSRVTLYPAVVQPLRDLLLYRAAGPSDRGYAGCSYVGQIEQPWR